MNLGTLWYLDYTLLPKDSTLGNIIYVTVISLYQVSKPLT